jgi:hypothetical protein
MAQEREGVALVAPKVGRTRRPNKAKLIEVAERTTGRLATSVTEFADGSVRVELGQMDAAHETNPLDDWRARDALRTRHAR